PVPGGGVGRVAAAQLERELAAGPRALGGRPPAPFAGGPPRLPRGTPPAAGHAELRDAVERGLEVERLRERGARLGQERRALAAALGQRVEARALEPLRAVLGEQHEERALLLVEDARTVEAEHEAGDDPVLAPEREAAERQHPVAMDPRRPRGRMGIARCVVVPGLEPDRLPPPARGPGRDAGLGRARAAWAAKPPSPFPESPRSRASRAVAGPGSPRRACRGSPRRRRRPPP